MPSFLTFDFPAVCLFVVFSCPRLGILTSFLLALNRTPADPVYVTRRTRTPRCCRRRWGSRTPRSSGCTTGTAGKRYESHRTVGRPFPQIQDVALSCFHHLHDSPQPHTFPRTNRLKDNPPRRPPLPTPPPTSAKPADQTHTPPRLLTPAAFFSRTLATQVSSSSKRPSQQVGITTSPPRPPRPQPTSM